MSLTSVPMTACWRGVITLRGRLTFEFALLLVVAVSCCLTSSSRAQSIGIYTEPDPPPLVEPDPPPPVLNWATVLPYVTTPLYVVAHMGSEALLQPGILGAEFSITGIPDTGELLVLPTVNPDAQVLSGSPIQSGAILIFPSCAAPSAQNASVLLYSLSVIAVTPVSNVTLRIDALEQPTNPALPYPLLYACGDTFAPVVAYGIGIVLNPTVAVEETNWGAVKQLFQ